MNGLTGGDFADPFLSFHPAAPKEGEAAESRPLENAAAVGGQAEDDPPEGPKTLLLLLSAAAAAAAAAGIVAACTGELPKMDTPVDWAVVVAARGKGYNGGSCM